MSRAPGGGPKLSKVRYMAFLEYPYHSSESKMINQLFFLSHLLLVTSFMHVFSHFSGQEAHNQLLSLTCRNRFSKSFSYLCLLAEQTDNPKT